MQPERPFDEPWCAQVFAMTVHLHEQDVFTWQEWADTLSTELHQSHAVPDGSDYYHHWANALEKLLVTKAITDPTAINSLTDQWTRAAHATPHGQPILLDNGTNKTH